MASDNVQAMVQAGINAYKAGRKDEARDVLLRAVDNDPQNENAWLWLSGLLDTEEDQRIALENVLTINPNNQRAIDGLKHLNGKPPTTSYRAPAAPPPPPAPAYTPPPAEDPYAIPTSAVGSMYEVAEPNPIDYDNWMDNVIPAPRDGAARSASFNDDPEPDPFNANAFDINMDALEGDAPVQSRPTAPPPQRTPAPTAMPNYGSDDDDDIAQGDLSFLQQIERQPMPSFDSPIRPTVPAPVIGTGFGMDDDFEVEADAAPAPTPGRRGFGRGRANKAEAVATPAAPAPRPRAMEIDDEPLLEARDGDYLRLVPKDIKATRLPGEVERVPTIYRLGVAALAILNIGAAVLLFHRLFLA